MKRFITLVVFSCFSFMLAQDAAGTYKLVGTDVRYSSLLRQAATLSATTNYGGVIGATIPLLSFDENEGAGQIRRGPYNEGTLGTSGAFLNVTFREDGTGTINPGSFYPSITLDEETCISGGSSLPITDELVYTSDLTPNNYVQTVNYIGLPNMGVFGGGFIGKISLSQSEELDFFEAGQSVGALGVCQAGFYVYDAEGNPLAQPTPCDSYDQPGNDCHVYEGCMSAGYISKGHGVETILGNGERDMYVEWHAVDGPFSDSGFGDDPLDPCEDDLCVANQDQAQCIKVTLDADGNQVTSIENACTESGEAFDRILGVPGIPVTTMSPDCGFDGGVDEDGVQIYQYVAGDPVSVGGGLAAGVQGACITGFQADNNGSGYPDVYDGCQALSAGGDTTPATNAFIGACTQLGFDLATCSLLAAAAQQEVESTTGCYDFETNEFTPADSADECVDGEVFTNAAWDCYGLLGLTYQAADLCALAGAAYVDQCVMDTPDENGDYATVLARDFFVLSAEFSDWGGYFTWNTVAYSQCCGTLAYQGIDCTADGVDTCDAFLASDGAVEFDPACLADGDTSDCAGRLAMSMNGLCVPTLDVREVHIDFDEIATCAANGDVNFDDTINILDVLRIVQHIIQADLLNDEQLCNGDVTQDDPPLVNIQDIIQIVNIILNPAGRAVDASMIEIFNNDNIVSMEADGYVGAIQMTLSHSNDFSIELTNNAFIAESHTDGNQTILMIVNPENDLFVAEGSFEIEEIIAANSNDMIDVINPEAISLGKAYPNPFNPTTSFDLNVGVSGHVTMNVYNLMGQVVGTLVNNTMDAGSYNITWDAGNFASGMYVVKAETVNGIASQKVMLVK